MVEDYPQTLLEFEHRFATDQACRDYLIQLRWPHGFVCPHCGARTAWAATRGRFVCGGCRHQTSATAGTIFHDTRKPLRLWFRAMWYVTSQKNGASAMGLQRVLGLGSYLDRVDVAAQTATGDGSAGPRSAERTYRSR